MPMPNTPTDLSARARWLARIEAVRARSLALAAPLSAEDQGLQSMHASTQFAQLESPPRDRGITWSIVSSSLPGLQPQY